MLRWCRCAIGWHNMNNAEKLAAAIEWMGPRYVFHPSRAVKRIPAGQHLAMHTSDIAATFKKEYARLAQREATT